MDVPKYNIVLIQPEIPGNSGNIGRSCMAQDCRLHLVHPLGYEISDKQLKRAGMDYWPEVDLVEHENVAAWLKTVEDSEIWLMSTKAKRNFNPALVSAGAHLVFGSEGGGLPAEIWEKYEDKAVRIPMNARARSMNLSSSAAMILGSLILK